MASESTAFLPETESGRSPSLPSHAENHDFGCLDEGGSRLPGFQLHFASGTRGDDGGDPLVADGKRNFRHQSADAHVVDATDKLIATTDATEKVVALGKILSSGAEEKAVNFALRDAVVASGGAHTANLPGVDPLFDRRETDSQL